MNEVDPTAAGVTVRFPAPRIGDLPLTLPKGRSVRTSLRNALEASLADPLEGHAGDAASELSNAAPILPGSMAEMEQHLRRLEAKLEQRERELVDQESWISERERELAETEALVAAREAMLAASRKGQSSPRPGATVEEQRAFERLRHELDRRENSLRELRVALTERERFLDESEARLLRKVQLQQEKETELEQREEELVARERKQRAAAAANDPILAEELRAELAVRSANVGDE